MRFEMSCFKFTTYIKDVKQKRGVNYNRFTFIRSTKTAYRYYMRSNLDLLKQIFLSENTINDKS